MQASLAVSGAEPQPKLNLVHFSLKIRHLVATNLKIFLRIKWRNFMQNFLMLCRIQSGSTDSWGCGSITGGVRRCKISLGKDRKFRQIVDLFYFIWFLDKIYGRDQSNVWVNFTTSVHVV